MNNSSIPIDSNFFERLYNRQIRPDILDYMAYSDAKEQCLKQEEVYNKAEEKELFEDIIVEYESCDCGGEYGCSHGDYPYNLIFASFEGDVSVEIDEYLMIEANGYSVTLPINADATMEDFINACKLLRIPVTLKK